MAETLERSVLERKERDELATIATALGMKPSGRAKKDTLIDQILRTAGVDVGGGAVGGSAVGGGAVGGGAVGGNAVGGGAVGGGPTATGGDGDGPKRRGRKPKNPAIGGPDPATDTFTTADAGTNGSGSTTDRPASSRAFPRRSPGSTLFDPFAEADAAPSYDPKAQEAIFETPTPLAALSATSTASNGGPGGATDSPVADIRTVPTPGELQDAPARQEGRERDRGRNRDRDRGDRPGYQGGGQGGGSQGGGSQGGGSQGGGSQGGQGGGQGAGQGGRYGDQGGANSAQGKRFDNDASGKRRRRRGRDRQPQVSPERDAAADRISESYQGELLEIEGLLDMADQGYGYIRAQGYLPSVRDVYVPVNRVKQLGLRRGDMIVGKHRPATPQEKFPAIVQIDSVNGLHPEVARLRPKFEDLTPLFPDVKLRLEQPGQSGNMVARIVDLVSPIGKGQRGLIVSPPKAGKTTIMKQIASSIESNNPEVKLMVLLIDERPEEVTDMRRHVKGEVVASTFDKPSDEHTMVAELAIERAKRLVEEGKDVVIILDGITRLARAYNLAAPATGRIMSGGIDTGALYPPKKFFGAARNIEEGGSLTILATALIETGSTMDTVIFEEFKGTGNMELRLDRRLAEKRVYPAINVNESSTRHEELLFEKFELEAVWKLRRVLNGLGESGSAAAGLELLMDRIKTTRTNIEFLTEIAKANSPQ